MHRAVAGNARRRIRVAGSGRLSVDALPELLHFIGMALCALCRGHLRRRHHLVMIAVAGFAHSLAQSTMNAIRHVRRLIGVAGRTSHLRYSGVVGIVLDGRVAVNAGQYAVDAGGMLNGINRDALAAAGGHARLPVTGEATLILL